MWTRNLIGLSALALVAAALYSIFVVEPRMGRAQTAQPVPAPETFPEIEIETDERPLLRIDIVGEGANGPVLIDLFEDVAPRHAERLLTLAREGAYDNVVFHRVIDGFMAQTGDVRYGKLDDDLSGAGMGGSDLPDLPAEFSDIPFTRGIVGMARARSPNSANSQFFIMFADAPHLNGQYTVVGKVVHGMDVVDRIKRGEGPNGMVLGVPDRMARVTVIE